MAVPPPGAGRSYFLAALPSPRVMEDWGVDEYRFTAQEQAYAAFFACATVAFAVRREPVIRDKVEDYVSWQRAIADRCRLAAGGDITLRTRKDIVDALLIAAKYFNNNATLIEGANKTSPLVLKGRGKTPEDDVTRGQIRSLALETNGIFGTFSLGILAKVASVALQKTVTKRAVQAYCEGLTHTAKNGN